MKEGKHGSYLLRHLDWNFQHMHFEYLYVARHCARSSHHKEQEQTHPCSLVTTLSSQEKCWEGQEWVYHVLQQRRLTLPQVGWRLEG